MESRTQIQDQINFEGNIIARLEIPALSGFPFDLINPIFSLPFTVASTENHILNTHIYGCTQLTPVIELTYDLNWDGTNLNANWGANFSLWNEMLFENQFLINDRNEFSINRFEGQSLVISGNYVNKTM